MSKLSFRARALDAARPLAVWLAEELPELPDYSAISRAVPQMPSGMEKEEECEHHLQRAICTGLIIPTPEVSDAADIDFYERCYPPDYKMPKQLIHMQPLCLEQETPEYDMDSEDERWLRQQHYPELTELKFEEMMDRLERSSGQTVVQLSEAKLLLERNDDLVIAVYDYWLNKRLKTQHPLILSVRTENRAGQAGSNPYLAFRRRTEKMQTRKNRKNDESSYEKMLKLRRDLSRAASLLELVVRRERAKRDLVKLTRLLAEKRYQAGDFAGHMLAELAAVAPVRSAGYAAVSLAGAGAGAGGAGYRREQYSTHYAPRAAPAQQEVTRQRDKRQNKRRKHRHHGSAATSIGLRDAAGYSSSEEELSAREVREERREEAAPAPPADDGPFAFRRKAGVYYQMPTSSLCGHTSDGYESPSSAKENLHARDKRHRFTLTSISDPYPKCVGFARRRLGRGGRVILDRIHTPLDDLWPHLRYPYSKSSRHRTPRPAEDSDRQRYRYPRELVEDYTSGGKYTWRHAFKYHYTNDPTKWTKDNSETQKEGYSESGGAVKEGYSENVGYSESAGGNKDGYSESAACLNAGYSESAAGRKEGYSERAGHSGTIKTELMDTDVKVLPQDCNKLKSGDISLSARLRRGKRRRRPSESSLDSAAELEPHEEEFGRLLEQVNKEWLHFRPKTPPTPAREPEPCARVALAADARIAVELRLAAAESPSRHLFKDSTPFTTSEFTLADLYRDVIEPDAIAGGLDGSGEDSVFLADNFSGLTDAQVESILSDTDLKAIADEDLKDGRKNSIDLLRPDDADAILEELVKTEVPFLLAGQSAGDGRAGLAASAPDSGLTRRRRDDGFGSSVVSVAPLEAEPILVDVSPPEPPAPTVLPSPQPKPVERPPPKKVEVKTTIVAPVPVVETPPQIKLEPKRKIPKEEILEDIQVAQGVQLKTVQTKHSPLKKHIITSTPHRRNESVTLVTSQNQETQPQIVTVSVSESLKARLQNHLLATSAGQVMTLDAGSVGGNVGAVVGLVQNGPFTVSSAGGVAVAVPTSVSVAVSREGGVSMGGASTSSPRRVSAPLVHLTPSLHQKQLLSASSLTSVPPVVVTHSAHTLQHVAPNKLKVLHAHTLTQSQRTQLLAQSRAAGITQLPAVVSLSTLGDANAKPTTALQLKTTPGAVAQFYEIKSGQLGKGPHLVNVVRQPQPGKTTVARLDLNDAKKRGQVVATFDGTTLKGNIATAARPHRVSVLDGRQLVRASLPTVRAHQVRHQIQLKNRTLVPSPQHPAPTSITIAAPSKTTSLPNSVVANLLQKSAMTKGGQKIAIAGGGGQLANVQAFATFTHAQQLKARQARLVTQPRANTSAELLDAPTTSGVSPSILPQADSSSDAADTTTNGAVRRRGDNLPMEVT